MMRQAAALGVRRVVGIRWIMMGLLRTVAVNWLIRKLGAIEVVIRFVVAVVFALQLGAIQNVVNDELLFVHVLAAVVTSFAICVCHVAQAVFDFFFCLFQCFKHVIGRRCDEISQCSFGRCQILLRYFDCLLQFFLGHAFLLVIN